MSGRTVLITGADGYAALHFVELLKKHNICAITSSRSGDHDLMMDFAKPESVVRQKISSIDAMVHFVSPNENLYKSDSYRALSENAAGIHAALDFCKANQIPDFIYLSSFHVFGTAEGIITEASLPAPGNYYGLAHLTAEQTVQMYDRTGQVNGWVVRPSNIFGVPASMDKFKRWNLIPFLFCKEAVEKRTITLLTPGNQLRNFAGITDVCKTLLWLLNNRPQNRIFHAYGNETISVYQFAQLVQRIAKEHFALNVHITRPEWQEPTSQFTFKSTCEIAELEPGDQLETFVADMLCALIQRNE